MGAAYGIARGGGVVVWDNNEFRGNAADRSFCAHRNTVKDLLARSSDLMRPDARVADIQSQLNYQASGQFWVLASSQAGDSAISQDQFRVVREILSRFFAVIIIDTGNSEVAEAWIEAVHHGDCLVVPTAWKRDSAKGAALMLDSLADKGLDVADRAVIVGTNGPRELMTGIQSQAPTWFNPRPIIEVPTDPHIAQGVEIDSLQLAADTRRAYQRLGATVSKTISVYLSTRH